MYLNQACSVKWNIKNLNDFSVSNRVKQGAVLSSILFTAYMDKLFKQLKHNGIGCHVGPVYGGAFWYNNNINNNNNNNNNNNIIQYLYSAL